VKRLCVAIKLDRNSHISSSNKKYEGVSEHAFPREVIIKTAKTFMYVHSHNTSETALTPGVDKSFSQDDNLIVTNMRRGLSN